MVPVNEVFCGLMAWALADMQKAFSQHDAFIMSARNAFYGFYAI